jgi:two-component system response regulator MtrA
MKRPLVLIVDDEVDIAEMIGALLEAEHYEVEYAANGREGLEAVARVRPDVILTDVMMPVMSGPEMLTELRRHGSSDIPVVIMSAADVHRLARSFGVPYLQKPFHIEELLKEIQAQLGR